MECERKMSLKLFEIISEFMVNTKTEGQYLGHSYESSINQ